MKRTISDSPTFVIVFFSSAAAFQMVFSNLFRTVDADTILISLISTLNWTPFYWEQNRFGTLIPALTTWIQNPLYNFLAQNLISSFFGVSAFLIGGHFFFPGRKGIIIGGMAFAAWVLFFPPNVSYNLFFGGQPYAISVALLFISAILFRQLLDRLALSLPCFLKGGSIFFILLLTQWVNLGIMPFAMVLFFVYSLFWKDYRWTLFLLLVIVSFWINLWLMRLAPYNNLHQMGLVPFKVWINSFPNMGEIVWIWLLEEPFWPIAFSVFFGITLSVRLFRKSEINTNLSSISVPCLTSASVFYFFLTAMKWVAVNHYHPRYAILSFFLIFLVLGTIIFNSWPIRLDRRRWLIFLSLCMLSPMIRYGYPDLSLPRKHIDSRFGTNSSKILEWNATFVVGSYWGVWPSVFHARWKAYETGKPVAIYGLSQRSRPTEHKWRILLRPGSKLVGFVGDQEFEKYMKLYMIGPTKEVTRTKHLILFEIE